MNAQQAASKSPSGTGKTFAIDPQKMVRFMDAKIAATENLRHRRNLKTVRDHMYYEAMLDPDGVMSTLSPDASYTLWIGNEDMGPKTYDAIRDWYIDTNIRRQRSFVIEYDLNRVMVDDDTVVTEGQMNLITDAQYAKMFGVEVVDPAAIYLQSFRQIVFWPLDAQGKCLGEDFYTSGCDASAFRRLREEEIHPDWFRLVALAEVI